MLVCVECKREMVCDKNSVGADFGYGHVYPGDRYKCKTCGKLTILTNRSPDFDPDYKHQGEYLRMEEE